VPVPSHDDLRRLAVWLARRREVDEMMAVLTQYGPTANDRVASHLQALTALLDSERDAFDRYAAGAPTVAQKPLPVVLPEDEEEPANVHSLFSARLARKIP
jgi:hypothetical protein